MAVKRTAGKVLKKEKMPGCSLSVTYVTDGRIRRLNRKYKGKGSCTDVLAFSMKEGRRLEGEGEFLGDVVISLDAARRQAGRFKSTYERELRLYLIHGILHLLGYDDLTGRDRQKMVKRQEELLGET